MMVVTLAVSVRERRLPVPSVTVVQKAKKEQGACGRCGDKIDAGSPYRWWKFRYGGRRIRCMKPGCSPRRSHLTNSDKLSRCYAAGEAIEDAINAFRDSKEISDLRSALEEAASEARDVAEEYRESAQNIEDGFNHPTQQSEELAEKADNLESQADEIDSVASNLEEFDAESVDGLADEALAVEVFVGFSEMIEGQAQWIEAHRAEIDALRAKKIADAREDWADEQASNAEDCVEIDPEG
jgi:hypothetical protein